MELKVNQGQKKKNGVAQPKPQTQKRLRFTGFSSCIYIHELLQLDARFFKAN
jgi:hypothetical protein